MSDKFSEMKKIEEAVRQSGITAEDFEQRKKFIDFNEDDVALLRELAPVVSDNAPRIVDVFYANVQRYPQLMNIIQGAGSEVNALKGSQIDYLNSMFGGTYDEKYMIKRLRIGVVHFIIGLGPRWYLGSYSLYMGLLAELINKRWPFNAGKRLSALQAVNKVLSLDSQLAIDSYMLAVMNSINSTVVGVQSGLSQQTAAAAEQAASMSQTSTSLSQIRETSDSTMGSVRELSEMSRQTVEESLNGLREITESVKSVESIREQMDNISMNIVELGEQTKRIAEITATVNGLAQQSKMLAINASIEAAQAGEAGKGFTVVASEVGNLAQQSAEATQQVRQILEQIQKATEKAVMATEEGTKKVGTGVSQIQNAGQAMENLRSVIETTAQTTEGIMASIRQQDLGIGQVSDAMTDLNSITSQYASTSSQINDAINGLVKYVDNLRISD